VLLMVPFSVQDEDLSVSVVVALGQISPSLQCM